MYIIMYNYTEYTKKNICIEEVLLLLALQLVCNICHDPKQKCYKIKSRIRSWSYISIPYINECLKWKLKYQVGIYLFVCVLNNNVWNVCLLILININVCTITCTGCIKITYVISFLAQTPKIVTGPSTNIYHFSTCTCIILYPILSSHLIY